MADDPGDGQLLQFPPLPRPPLPPRLPPDPRQRTRDHIVGALSSALSGGHMQLATGAGAPGYPASAVNLGHLKDALETALQRFDMDTVRARWGIDVRSFVHQVLTTWVQRVKELEVLPDDIGIAITLTTQDDHGYYRYSFDVFPGQKPA